MSVSKRRWVTKKAARYALMLASSAARKVVPQHPSASTPTVRILTYHRFGHCPRDPWCVDTEVFETQMRRLSEQGLAVSLDQVVRFARGELQLRDGSVLVTMDDGFSSVRTVAAPIMQRYGIPGVAYLTTSLIESDATTLDGERYLTWQQAGELSAFGLTVGSHAHTHSSLGQMPIDQACAEGETSKRLLEQHLGLAIHSFAYPFGMRPDESPATAHALGALGYESVLIAQHGVVHRGADVLRLPRIKVEGGEPAWTFDLICAGAMDAWKFVDDTLWRLQRPR